MGATVARESQVCKTFIRRFDSDPRLHPNRLAIQDLQPKATTHRRGRIRTNPAIPGRIQPVRQTFCQTFCQTYPYVYSWGPRGKLPGAMDRKGQTCRVLARSRGRRFNSALVEFSDGFLAVVSRNALRRRQA